MADPPLTPNQRLYLHAFDMFLRARSKRERAAARSLMSLRLDGMLDDVGGLELPNDLLWQNAAGWERDHGHNGSGNSSHETPSRPLAA